uniref:BZIP domain-containing protein n=1 Tax=Steinernema glaseri TaxID=37863 RepID=A0A1I8AEG9_9BILA
MNSSRSVSSGNSSPSTCSEASSSRSSPCYDHVFPSTSKNHSGSNDLTIRARKPKRVHAGKHRPFSVKRRGSPRKGLHKIAARKHKKARRSNPDLEFERELLKEIKQVKALQAKTRALEEAGREMELQISSLDRRLQSFKQTVYQRQAVISTVITTLVLSQQDSTGFEYEFEQYEYL